MKPQRRKKKKPALGSRRRLPRDFICIAPAEAALVYESIFGSVKGHKKEIAKLHYHLCLHCQETVDRMRLIEEAVVNDDAKEWVHGPGTCSGSPVNVADVNKPDLVQREEQILTSDPETLLMKAAGDI